MSNFPKLKLVYFNAAGRAEAARLAFHIGNVPFEDHRFSYADFNALKPTFPYAQAPVLEVDGEAIAQSQGILRYAGRLANLYPVNDPLAALKVDEILNAFDELQDKISPSFREQDPEKKKAMREELAKTTIPHYLRFLEARLLKMKEYPVFATGDIFIHDITVYAFMRIIRNGVLDHVPTDLADSYVEINASAAKVENHHRVKEWYANPRNVTPKFKLTYFAGPGRAEPIRLAFHVGGVEFEDERIDWAEFEKRRASLPFGQVPVLDVNGDVLAQSLPILRYVGAITGLYPANDPLLAMRIDEFFGVIDELYNSIQPTYRMEPEAQLAARKVLVETTFQKLLSAADKRVATKGGKYAVGDKLTVADLAIYGVVLGFKAGNMNGVPTTLPDQFENLTRIFNLVQEHPKVQAYLAAKK